MQQLESDLDVCQEKLLNASQKLEEKEKALLNAEGEVAALNRRVQQLEEDLEKSEERFIIATQKLDAASTAGDDSQRMCKVLESKSIADDADKKYDEIAKKLAGVEADLERGEERADTSEHKIIELEEELRVVGNNLKSLEVSEEKANQREEHYKGQIKTLTAKLKQADARAEFAEKSVQKLQKEVDRLEDELVNEKEKFKAISDELDQTFAEMSGY